MGWEEHLDRICSFILHVFPVNSNKKSTSFTVLFFSLGISNFTISSLLFLVSRVTEFVGLECGSA